MNISFLCRFIEIGVLRKLNFSLNTKSNEKSATNSESLRATDIVNKIVSGDRLWLSKAITILESANHRDRKLANEILDMVLPYSGKSWRIGITGVPGVGKSTFIDALGQLILSLGHKMAVLAIDPSSQKTGGSILGDKTRMHHIANHKNVFIRPSPAAKTLGGVAAKTRETIFLLEAAGFDMIVVETVGVGQSEISVHSMVDFLILLVLTGAGDEVQGMKRGIMEIADAVVVNKADKSQYAACQKIQKQYEQFFHFLPHLSFWVVPVLLHSTQNPELCQQIWQKIESYMLLSRKQGYFENKRQEQKSFWLQENIRSQLEIFFSKSEAVQKKKSQLQNLVQDSQMSSNRAAELILREFIGEVKSGQISIES